MSAAGLTTAAVQNVAVGSSALGANTSGYKNNAIGYGALQANTTGNNNTANGQAALSSSQTIGNNTAMGYASLLNLTAGSDNTAIGLQAGRYYNGTTGALTSQSYSTFLGDGTSPLANGETNETVIGYNAIGNGSNTVTIGNSSNLRTYLAGLNLSAGTATAGTAPLKFTAGTNLGTTEAGAVEYNGTHLYFTATNGGTRYQLDQQSGGTSALSGLTVATGTNTINNGTYAQEWQWNTLAGNSGLKLSSTSTAATSNLQKLFEISTTGANSTSTQTTYGAYLSNTHSGTASTNVGLYTTASGATNNIGLDVDQGQSLFGGTTLITEPGYSQSLAQLNIVATNTSNGSQSAIAGIHGNYTFTNGGAANYVQVGNRFVVTNNPTTNSNTAIGEMIRMYDATSLSNLVRGIDITANAGGNTQGTNTGLRAIGATFGVQGFTSALAGSAAVPAALYGESTGTTQGDTLRLYSGTVTTANSMATFYQDTSSFSGTGLLMKFATGSGAYTGNFIDLQNNNASVFKVTSGGVLSMGLSSTAATSAVCSSLANGTAPTAGVSYEIRDCSSTPVADYAEMYPVENGIEVGDIVIPGQDIVSTYDTNTSGGIDWTKVKGNIAKLTKSTSSYQDNVIGIVSDNTNDFSSTGYNIKDTDHPMPIALNGRVPVKVSSTSEAIKIGDYVTTSGEVGKAMKATKSGYAIGKALENWDPTSGKQTVMIFVEQGYYHSDLVNNFTGSNTFDGLTFFNSDVTFAKSITFAGTAEFTVPPLFNSDTAGFAVIKAGSNRVDITFDKAYIATPVVNATMTFEKQKNADGTVTPFDTASFFSGDFKSLIVDKDENGFSIAINKNATQDIRFSWTAFAVKNPKVFESVLPGLVIDSGTNTTPPTTGNVATGDSSSTPSAPADSQTASVVPPTGDTSTNNVPPDTTVVAPVESPVVTPTVDTPPVDATPAPAQ